MDERSHRALRGLSVLESVRCLVCGSVYSKPVGGGTTATNPGCPECGYLGWLPVSGAELWPPRHSFGDPPRRRSA